MKEIKFLLTMFWGASLMASWNFPWWVVASTFEITFLIWCVPVVFSLLTIGAGIGYITDNWNKPWGTK